MRNKMGFTLVELLAVLVVLVIILSISVPTITNVITRTTKKAFESDASMIIRAIKNKLLYDENFNVTTVNKDNIYDLLKLPNTNYENINVTIEDNVLTIVVIGKEKWDGLIACGSYNKILVTDSVQECGTDLIAPIITILGDNPININIGEAYDDAGATALDDVDGDITDRIIVTGNVMPSIPGVYAITYTVSDAMGNESSLNRTVNVIDNVSPITTFNPLENSVYSKSRSTLVNVEDISGINNESLKYVWTTSPIEPLLELFSASFVNGGSITTPSDVSGSYYLWIYAMDLANNSIVSRSNIFNLDNEKPVITLNGNNDVFVNKGSSYTDLGATVTDNIDNNVSVVSSGTVNPNIVGTYTVTYDAIDSSGNEAVSIIRTVNVIDVAAPVITILGNNPINVNVGSVYSDAGATALDDVDGNVTSNIVVTGTVNPSIVGTYYITYTVKDSAQNESIATRTVNVIDNIAPTVAFGTNGNTTYAKSRSTTVTISDTHTGVNTSSLKYLWNTSTTAPSEASFSTSFTNGGTVSSPAGVTGGYYLWILAKDTSDNIKIQRTNIFNLDNTKPVITLTGSSPVNLNVGTTYTDAGATATDAHSGVNGTVTSTGTVNVNVVGTYTVTYNVSDNAGNAATSVTRTVNVIDNIAPTVAFGTNGNATYAKTRSTTVTISDAHTAVNTSSLKYLWNTSTTAPSEASFSTSFTNGGTITSTAGVTGGYYLWILAKDTAGNTLIQRTNVFNLDNTAPVITGITSSASGITINGLTINRSGNASDANSGLATNPYIYQTSLNGSTWTTQCTNNTTTCAVTGLTGDTLYYYRICANDTLSNQSCISANTTRTLVPDYIASEGVNKPRLVTGMTPIKWNGSAWVTTTESDADWYNYTTTDKKWANARTADGSMWVWIPRYIYKVTSGWHSSSAGVIDIQFSMGTDDTRGGTVTLDTGTTASASNNKWTNHPAFTFGTTQLTGIWVAKFEATASEGVSNNDTTDDVTTKTVKVVPNVTSWRWISIGKMFTVCRAMETKSVFGWGTTGTGIDTHMMKNVEWGAAAYLSKSTYGVNAEIWINPTENFTTGCAGTSVSSNETVSCNYAYQTTNGVKASTTGNIYGIYDMSGGSWEKVAAYLNNGNSNLSSYGSNIVSADAKYKDVYTVGTSDTQANNYTQAINKKGDAIYETSSSGVGEYSWYYDYSQMVYTNNPWFIRGGYQNNGSYAGAFYYEYMSGEPFSGDGFRPVLVIETGL